MAELDGEGRFTPPCHWECDGEVRYTDPDGGNLIGTCPAAYKPGCWIPARHDSAKKADLTELGWPARYLTESTWDGCEVEDEIRLIPATDGILILGPTGTGKTSAAALVALTRWPTQRWGYVYWRDVIQAMGDGIPKRLRARHLVVDDYGVGDVPPWKVGDVDGFWEWRNAHRVQTIVTSNLTRSQLTEDRMAARWVDRWRQMMPHLVTIGGESRRG